jgi:dephospho-CoA kinase
MPWSQLTVSVTSGVVVALLVAIGRSVWIRKRLPAGPSRHVTRRTYLSAILEMSMNQQVRRICALVPNLVPAAGSDQLTRIQTAWQGIESRGNVRIVTRENQDCLSAGAELLSRGIEVRVGRALNTDGLSFHIFSGDAFSVVINHRDTGRDHPSRLIGLSLAQVFQSHFDQVWDSAVPLESVLAEQVLSMLRPGDGPTRIAAQMQVVRTKYRLDAKVTEAVLRHVAFHHAAPVVFVTGLPGTGKSVIRRHLAEKLTKLRFQIDQQTDYLYAFRDFLHHAINLEDGRGVGFSAHAGGAFHVRDEHDLEPALQSLSKRVWESRGRTSLTLVEFARSDLVAALQVFGDEVLASAQIIYVRASEATRALRLDRRAQPPRVAINGQNILVQPSDDHQLPSPAAKSLYTSDDFIRLRGLKEFEGRLHQIDNDVEDPTFTTINEKLETFIKDVIRPYTSPGLIVSAN